MRETFAFSAAHHIPSFPEGHKCRSVHGHTWRVVVDVEVPDPSDGQVIDHANVRAMVWAQLRELDHITLNDIPGLESGTAEAVLAWIRRALITNRGHLTQIRIDRIELIECSSNLGLWVEHSKIWTAED